MLFGVILEAPTMSGRQDLVAALVVLALFAGWLACAGYRGGHGVPNTIAAAAEEKSCTPFEALPEEDSPPDPSWLSLKALTGDPDDYVFLCKSKEQPSSLAVLVSRSQTSPWMGCPSLVGEISWTPAGLSILTREDAAYPGGTLGLWNYATGTPGPADVELTKPVIDTTLGIAGMFFYCHDGRWLELFVH
jgi:hypothetical protein